MFNTARSGTTVPNFSLFCWTLHACHTVNNSPIFLKSSLMDSAISASSQLSGEKTWSELSSLKAFLQLFKYYVRFFGQKTSKKMSALLKKLNLCSTYFLNGKWYWKISNGFELQSLDSLSYKKWHKLNLICLCTAEKNQKTK